jgi:hypothetical protein
LLLCATDRTGAGNAKYWILKELIDGLQLNDTVVPVQQQEGVFAFAVTSAMDGRRVVLINKTASQVTVDLPSTRRNNLSTAKIVDESTGDGPARVESVLDSLELAPFAFAVVYQ